MVDACAPGVSAADLVAHLYQMLVGTSADDATVQALASQSRRAAMPWSTPRRCRSIPTRWWASPAACSSSIRVGSESAAGSGQPNPAAERGRGTDAKTPVPATGLARARGIRSELLMRGRRRRR
jgi:hypothetical protein